ncbi:MAG TPA: hypothetical protein VL948_25525 [Verrucomicrobiae bacterium]|jgi:hypothetical protein|nr:hypothetical protein [Verrucomicrobiae bacterium]
MIRLIALTSLVALALPLGACSLDPERQWYKPNGNYTSADFDRDTTACTKDRVLDETCLKQRGWVPLSGDIVKKQAEKPPAGSANRY